MKSSRTGIALLITVMFVIVITVAIGYALKQINKASQYVEQETMLYQNFVFVDDVLNLLNGATELQDLIKDEAPEDLYTFLSSSGFITFEHQGVRLVLHITSARREFCINQMTKDQEEYLYDYLGRYNVRGEYIDILKDSISGIKEDNSYFTRLFEEQPELFRDYIASKKHLKKLNDFYKKEYRDDTLDVIDFDNLFSYAHDDNVSIDLNYATPQVWELLTGMDVSQAEVFGSGENIYKSVDDLQLNEEQIKRLNKFSYSFFEPYLQVKMDIIKDNFISHISFEYSIKDKKGYNFVYEI
ncbi:hypothetical protein [Sulfurimonas sp.]|uniref:hypothetical protein n=1 Tax=Sulfurimonas sp. TaxID=2022749 RepID=UPI003D0D63C8